MRQLYLARPVHLSSLRCEMGRILAIAAFAIIGAAAHPVATTVDMQVDAAAHLAFTADDSPAAANPWDGTWQGTTVSGVPLVLQLQVQGQRVTGRLTVGKQSANILEGKVVGIAFALVTDKIDGHRVDGTGRRVG